MTLGEPRAESEPGVRVVRSEDCKRYVCIAGGSGHCVSARDSDQSTVPHRHALFADQRVSNKLSLRSKRRELQAVNGAVGLVLGLGGYIGQLYSSALATFLMFAVWIVGATLINLLTDRPTKK